MEPIKINIEVSLSRATIEALENFGHAIAAGCFVAAGKAGELVREAEEYMPEEFCEPESVIPQAPAPVEEDMPEEFCEPEPVREVNDQELLAAVAECKKARSAAEIRALFNEFGIPNSTKCPMDKRPALVERLKALTDHA